jgi:Zn-dependent peptidase ImmA (M78 family)
MNRRRREHLEREAEQILHTSGTYRLPVAIDRIAAHLNLRTTASDLGEDMSGLLVVDNNRAAIGYNSMHPSVRQRFTIAHEIGHYVLHAKRCTQACLFIDKYVLYRRDQQPSLGNDQQEVEANAFAAALLMPAQLVREEIKRQDFDLDDDDDLHELARRFKVSASAMSNRLANLGLLRWIPIAVNE